MDFLGKIIGGGGQNAAAEADFWEIKAPFRTAKDFLNPIPDVLGT